MPTGSADQPCPNTPGGKHPWSHNAALGMQCPACGASRAHDPVRDGPPPHYRGPSPTRRRRERVRSVRSQRATPRQIDVPDRQLALGQEAIAPVDHEWTGDEPISEAESWLRYHVQAKGAVCPTCHKWAKIDARSLNRSMARGLITIYRETVRLGHDHIPQAKRPGIHIARLFQRKQVVASNDGAINRHWGLIEPAEEDGEAADGYYRITDFGIAFVQGTVSVQRRARMYGGGFYGLEGGAWAITDALGSPFDYREQMDWEVTEPVDIREPQ